MVVTPSLVATDRLWGADESNALRRLGVFMLLLYGFVRFSFVSEIANHITNSRPFLVLGLGLPATALMLISGGIRRTFRARPAYFMAGLMLWLLLVTPFSFWRGGSVEVLTQAFETEFSMLFLLAGLLLTIREVDKFFSVLALSGAFVILASFYYGSEEGGRFGFSFGSLENANDYATHLLLVMPFLLLVVFNSSSSILRYSGGVFILLGLYLVLKTGSRGALLALLGMLCFFFLKSNMAQRAAIALTVGALTAVLLFALPHSTVQRYLTLVDSSVEEQAATDFEMGQAVGSATARKDLLTNSLMVTATHPLVGVGPGMFAASDAERAKDEGRRGNWLVTHNSYTEISSETGVPGFVLFVGALLSSWLLLGRVYARAKKDPRFVLIRNAAFCIMLSILGFSICIFFAAMSYRYYLPTLVGLSIAFAAAAQREMDNAATARPVLSTLPWAPRTTR